MSLFSGLKQKLQSWMEAAREKTSMIKLGDRLSGTGLTSVIPSRAPGKPSSIAFPTRLDPAALAEWGSHVFQNQSTGSAGKALTILLCAYFLADVTALLVDKYIP